MVYVKFLYFATGDQYFTSDSDFVYEVIASHKSFSRQLIFKEYRK